MAFFVCVLSDIRMMMQWCNATTAVSISIIKRLVVFIPLTLLGWNLKELTLPAWPVYCNSAWPECIPQMMAVWSADAVPRMGNRIRETETSQMPSRWPVYLLKGVQFNRAGGPVWKKERPDQRPVLCQLIRLLLLPLRFDMILFVCCLSLLVCVLNLWAYKALDILVEDRPNPKPRVAGAVVVAGVMGTEKLPEMVLLLCCCCPTAVAVVCGCWVVAVAVVTVELVMKDVSADGALWLGVATVEAAVKVSTFSF